MRLIFFTVLLVLISEDLVADQNVDILLLKTNIMRDGCIECRKITKLTYKGVTKNISSKAQQFEHFLFLVHCFYDESQSQIFSFYWMCLNPREKLFKKKVFIRQLNFKEPAGPKNTYKNGVTNTTKQQNSTFQESALIVWARNFANGFLNIFQRKPSSLVCLECSKHSHLFSPTPNKSSQLHQFMAIVFGPTTSRNLKWSICEIKKPSEKQPADNIVISKNNDTTSSEFKINKSSIEDLFIKNTADVHILSIENEDDSEEDKTEEDEEEEKEETEDTSGFQEVEKGERLSNKTNPYSWFSTIQHTIYNMWSSHRGSGTTPPHELMENNTFNESPDEVEIPTIENDSYIEEKQSEEKGEEEKEVNEEEEQEEFEEEESLGNSNKTVPSSSWFSRIQNTISNLWSDHRENETADNNSNIEIRINETNTLKDVCMSNRSCSTSYCDWHYNFLLLLRLRCKHYVVVRKNTEQIDTLKKRLSSYEEWHKSFTLFLRFKSVNNHIVDSKGQEIGPRESPEFVGRERVPFQSYKQWYHFFISCLRLKCAQKKHIVMPDIYNTKLVMNICNDSMISSNQSVVIPVACTVRPPLLFATTKHFKVVGVPPNRIIPVRARQFIAIWLARKYGGEVTDAYILLLLLSYLTLQYLHRLRPTPNKMATFIPGEEKIAEDVVDSVSDFAPLKLHRNLEFEWIVGVVELTPHMDLNTVS